jgi:hypothetical protein
MSQITELQAQQRVTDQLIKRFGRDIALIRPGAYVSDGAGGRTRSGADSHLPAVRRFFSGTVPNTNFTVRFEGERQVGRFVLVGPPNDDIQQGDYWQEGATLYRVVFIHENPEYETRAEVVAIGT